MFDRPESCLYFQTQDVRTATKLVFVLEIYLARAYCSLPASYRTNKSVMSVSEAPLLVIYLALREYEPLRLG